MDSVSEEAPAGNEAIDVAYVAHLARLALTADEVALFQGQLSRIVDYVRAIQQVDVEGIEPTFHARPMDNVFRADAVKPSLEHATVLRNAPASRDGLFSVPKIVE